MKTLISCLFLAIAVYETRANEAPVDIALSALQAYVKAGNTGASDYFGYSVAVSGDTAVVGAYLEDSSTTGVNSTPDEGTTNSGAAYVFVRSGAIWTQQAYLKAHQVNANDIFGNSVAVSGDTVVIGALGEDSSTTGANSTPDEGATDSGAAYVFVRSGTIWSQQAYLKASNTGAGDQFGSSVAVSGDTVVVGAYREDSSTTGVNSTPNEGATDSGAAYVFVRSGTTWTQQAYLKASNTGVSDFFGNSVAVSGDTVVVGAQNEDSSTTGANSTPNENAANSGAAYVFVRSGTTWTQQAYLKASNTGANDDFGRSVAVSGDTVVVGAQNEDSSTTGANSTPNENAANSGAAYVFVFSGAIWTQQAYLKASNTGPGDYFGCSVAVSGDTVVVGAYSEDSGTSGVNSIPDEGATNSGAAYVFVRSGTTWTQQAYLKASNTGVSDFFGNSVAVSGDTVVVGALYEDSSTTGVNSTPDEGALNSGAAYFFASMGAVSGTIAENNAPNSVVGVLRAVDADVGDTHTYTLVPGTGSTDNSAFTINGNVLTLNTPADFETKNSYSIRVCATDAGGLFYEKVMTVTITDTNDSPTDIALSALQAYVKAGNTGASDRFGFSVAVSGDTAVVGAYLEDSSTTGVNSTPDEGATDSGAAYVFVRSGTIWTQQAYLKASNTGANDWFGWSVAVSGDTVVVGALYEDSSMTGVNSTPDEGATDSGAAYVFVRSGTTWTQQAYLKASNTGANDRFGCSVAVSGDTAVVGAYREDSSTTGANSTPDEGVTDSGTAYVFVRSGTIWTQQAYLKASNTGAYDSFGYSVAVSGDTVVVGAPWEDSGTTGVNSTPNEGATDSGAAYVFVRSGTTWTQQAYLKASNTGANDDFGWSVAVSGDTVVVGAWFEDSSTTGVNSTPDEGATYAGAAYVFVRSGTIWTQHAYLKAFNTGASDGFGCSVAVSGDTVVVGAHSEDSGTTGVNSTPDQGAANSGATYVFVRSGKIWTQQAYLKASNTGEVDEFGISVAVSGDTVVVGAHKEDSSTTGVNSTPNELASYSGAAYFFAGLGTASGPPSIAENNAPDSVVGTLLVVDDWGTHSYTLVSGTGSTDNAAFTINGNVLTLNTPANFETRNSYSIRVRVTDAQGLFYEKVFTVTVLPGAGYSQWQLTEFGVNAGNPAIAGELADPDHDTLINLHEFAFGTDPNAATGSIGIDESGTVTNPRGTPVPFLYGITAETVDFRAIFSRRKDYGSSGLIYIVEFSTLEEGCPWVASSAIPTLMDGSDAEIDVVYIPFPFFIQTDNGFEKPCFFRVGVSIAD